MTFTKTSLKNAAMLAGFFLTGSLSFAQPAQVPEPILFQDFENGNGE